VHRGTHFPARVLAGLIALAATAPSAAQSQTVAQRIAPITARLKSATTRILRDTGIPAISIALVLDGDVVWADAYGFANVAEHVPATAETYFSTGSTLKPVTAAAIMQLVDSGKLSLDKSLNAIVGPELAIAGADDVTLRHLLAHYSGLEGPMEMVPLWGRQSLRSPEETLAETHRVERPGIHYAYCNVCYSAAGYVIELISGVSFDEYLATRIFAPLGVETTTPTRPTPQVLERLALPYASEDGVTIPIDLIQFNVFAAGDAYLRPKDMAAFLAGVLNLGTYRGQRILSEASAAELMWPQFGSDDAGLGFNIDTLEGRTIVEKNGILPGYRIQMLGNSQTRDGVYVAANSTQAGPVTAALAELALRLLWGENPPPLASFREGR
jgi:CubicO group peptidase (beta-lactamase class C family)